MRSFPGITAIFLVFFYSSFSSGCKKDESKRYNVLFIAVDDLRPELGCYGNEEIFSPNIDQLAKKGTVFYQAYCQQALCNPSRASLMTGLRPDQTGVTNLRTHFREKNPEVITLSQHFKMNGYHARAFGKIYHSYLLDSLSWSTPNWLPKGENYASSENIQLVQKRRKEAEGIQFKNESERYNAMTGPSYECIDVDDTCYNDGQVAQQAIRFLRSRQAQDAPFFLAVGFYKPHLPFVAPKHYWDLYNPDSIPLAENPFFPLNAPDEARAGWSELRAYHDIPPTGPLDEEKSRTLKHGYYACVSYIDAQVGLLLEELKRQRLDKRTIVVIWGDHGWKLGEHAMWCKHTNFEIDVRAPLILASPSQKCIGKSSNALVEFVDVYPTLCDLAGLSIPSHLQGTSLGPLLDNPELKWKEAAFSQYPRHNGIMGYSMRTENYRFTQWFNSDSSIVATELYDHRYNHDENINVAGDPGSDSLISHLQSKLADEIHFTNK